MATDAEPVDDTTEDETLAEDTDAFYALVQDRRAAMAKVKDAEDGLKAAQKTVDAALSEVDDANRELAKVNADMAALLGIEPVAEQSTASTKTNAVRAIPQADRRIDQDAIVKLVKANGTTVREDGTTGSTSTEIAEEMGGLALAKVKGKPTASQPLRGTLAYMADQGTIKRTGSGRWSRYVPAD